MYVYIFESSQRSVVYNCVCGKVGKNVLKIWVGRNRASGGVDSSRRDGFCHSSCSLLNGTGADDTEEFCR